MNAKLAIICILVFVSIILLNNVCSVYGAEINDSVVSCDWLKENDGENIKLIDIRSEAEYDAGHIINSINIPLVMPASEWTVLNGDLLMEMPDIDYLRNMLGSYGINNTKHVVIVTAFDAPYPYNYYQLANATRVATTLKYTGVDSVSILDGGYTKWIAEGNQASFDEPNITAIEFKGKTNNMLVSKEYLQGKIGSSIIVDARDAEVYAGDVIEPYAPKAGHIETAVSLPTISIWNADGTYKTEEELEELAFNAIGDDKNKEVIIYCGVGGYASSWYYILTDVLKYKNVKIYDGSAQEWVLYNDMVN